MGPCPQKSPPSTGTHPLGEPRPSLPSGLGIKTVPQLLLQAMGSPHPNLAEADEGFSADLTERTQLGFGETVPTLKAHASHGDARLTKRSWETREFGATVRGDSIVLAAVLQAPGRRGQGKGFPFGPRACNHSFRLSFSCPHGTPGTCTHCVAGNTVDLLASQTGAPTSVGLRV